MRLFAAARNARMAIITGKTMMDRNVPAAVRDSPRRARARARRSIATGMARVGLRYAVTPRFAVTSSEAQLQVAGELLTTLPDALMQTHLSESAGEIARIRELYPE